MRKLFYAYLFIFLNINITINTSQICLTPTFVGYIIMLGAFRELERESEEFIKLRPYATGMAVYTGICWMLDAFGFTTQGTGGIVLALVLGLIGLAVSLYILKGVIKGIEDAEEKYSSPLGSDRLRSVYNVLLIAQVLSYGLMVIPPLALVAVLISFVSTIILLVRLNATAKAYEALETDQKW